MQRPAELLPWLVLVSLAPMVCAATQTDQRVTAEWETPHDREFDFWVGEWDVVLRVRQDDNSWEDSRFSVAKIYHILGGKAMLELWDEQVEGFGIRGFSLRHFDPERGEWVLYLNWPGRNRSGMGSLTGQFRHGRGEFFSTSVNQDGDTVISRYTFSDASPTSLRWDDAYSSDGGRTWSGNWIMEFSRTADTASWPAPGERAHTFYTGARCDRPEFRAFERLDGLWRGTIRVRRDDGSTAEVDARLTSYKVLDGCAVLGFLTYELDGRAHEEFSFKTYNTFANAFEDARLDNARGTPLRSYYGQQEGETLTLQARRDTEPAWRYRWTFDAPDRVGLLVHDLTGEAERELARGSFRRVSR